MIPKTILLRPVSAVCTYLNVFPLNPIAPNPFRAPAPNINAPNRPKGPEAPTKSPTLNSPLKIGPISINSDRKPLTNSESVPNTTFRTSGRVSIAVFINVATAPPAVRAISPTMLTSRRFLLTASTANVPILANAATIPVNSAFFKAPSGNNALTAKKPIPSIAPVTACGILL